eukprot:Seg625.8 transcript_id=Seg625.8/GoldUCD/mRNA.D3Y31 product="hypothetical protein" protein_id=Seg625.8/GoldUCD/D3Y31
MASSIVRMNSDDSYDPGNDCGMSLDSGYGVSRNFDGGPQKVAETTEKMKELNLSDSKKHTITTPSDTEEFEDCGNYSHVRGDQNKPQSSNNGSQDIGNSTQEESMDVEADRPIPIPTQVDASRSYAAGGVRNNSSQVLGRGRGRGRGRARVTQPSQLPVTNPAPEPGERLIKDLTVNDIAELAKYLDPDGNNVIKNWNHLALLLNIPEQERSALQRAYAGGGNPSLAFLHKLQTTHGSKPVNGLIEICKKMQRNDIVLYLKSNVSEHPTIGQIPVSILDILAEKLADKRISVIQCWKNLASHYGYSNQDIQSLASSIKDKNEYSPTTKLFQRIQAQYPDMTVNSLKTHLGNMNRYDVVRMLEKIMSKK